MLTVVRAEFYAEVNIIHNNFLHDSACQKHLFTNLAHIKLQFIFIHNFREYVL